MPRFFHRVVLAAWLSLVLQAGPSQPAMLRAQSPDNPLRPVQPPLPTLRIVPGGETPQAPPSVVPEEFGQPELLPPPVDRAPLPLAGFGDPDLSAKAPFQALVHPWFEEPWFSHGDPNDPRRHIGLGQPLIGTSWRNRPLYFGTFVGGILMDDLVPNRIYQNDTTFVGARLGYDFDHFWGLEGRWGFARPDLADGSGTPFFPASRDNFADVSLLYYPLGDARLRPYLLGGLGFTTFRFNNQAGQRISEAPLEVPLGFGVKYFYGPWFTLRFDWVDNLCLGNSRLSGMHNVSLMAGAEFRFGGRRPSYFPWHNNTSYW
jgi:hypothetical protein